MRFIAYSMIADRIANLPHTAASPCAPSRTGLPVGFQLVGAIGSDETLLDVAGEYERIRPWVRLVPL